MGGGCGERRPQEELPRLGVKVPEDTPLSLHMQKTHRIWRKVTVEAEIPLVGGYFVTFEKLWVSLYQVFFWVPVTQKLQHHLQMSGPN